MHFLTVLQNNLVLSGGKQTGRKVHLENGTFGLTHSHNVSIFADAVEIEVSETDPSTFSVSDIEGNVHIFTAVTPTNLL